MGLPEALAQAGWEDARTELVRPISKGYLGPLVLGRITAQHGASRLVTLRTLAAKDARTRLAGNANLASAMKDPRIVRILGVCSAAGSDYLASDPVRGLPAIELCLALRAADAPVIQEVALRIALDTLYGLEGAYDELRRVGIGTVRRSIYPDTVWITPEGEVQLSEVGIASVVAQLDSKPIATPWCPSEPSQETGPDDVFAVGAFLYELLTSRQLDATRRQASPKLADVGNHGQHLASEIVRIVNRALGDDPHARFADPGQMARAIEALPMHWIASDRQVRAAVELLVRTSDRVEDYSGLTSGEQAIDPWETPTRSLKMRLPR